MRRYLFPTDGPDSGKKLTLERWQSLFLTAVESERKPIIALRAASQIGKTLLALGVGLRSAVDGRGVLLASSTEVSARDLSRRLEAAIERSPFLASQFSKRSKRPRSSGIMEGSASRFRRMVSSGGERVRFSARIQDGGGCGSGRGKPAGRDPFGPAKAIRYRCCGRV